MMESVKEYDTYFDCLRSIENWQNFLSQDRQRNLASVKAMFADEDIEETCSSMVKNINAEFPSMKLQRRATFMITTLNIIIRVFTFDKYNIIISHKKFEEMVKACMDQLDKFYLDESVKQIEYAVEMLDLLLMNFAKDNLIIEYLERVFPNKPVSITDSAIIDEQRRQHVINSAQSFISIIIAFAADLSRKADIQSAEQFNNNYRKLMENLLTFVDHSFVNSDNHDLSEPQTDIIYEILLLMWNLADKTPLVFMFVSAGYVPKMIKWLEKPIFSNMNDDFREAIISIVYNLSRDEKGLKELHEVNAFKILMECKPFIDMDNKDLKEMFGMLILIALFRENEEQEQNKDLILEVSEELFNKTKTAFDNDNWRAEGVHISEYLYSLQCAFSSPLILRHILGDSQQMKKDRTNFFVDLLCSVYGLLFNQDTDYLEMLVIKSVLNIILCISNDEVYREELYSHVPLCILIESIAKQPNQDDAKRIWTYLQEYDESKSLPDKSKKEKASGIYISYNSSDREFCESFINALRKYISLPILVDYEQMDELLQDPWEWVGLAVDSASIIIVLVSNAYGQSKSNRQELIYAMRTRQSSDEHKSIIIVEATPNFKFNGDWMDALLKGQDKISYTEDFNQLSNTVANHKVLSKYKKHLSVPFSSGNTPKSQVCTIL